MNYKHSKKRSEKMRKAGYPTCYPTKMGNRHCDTCIKNYLRSKKK